MNAFMSAIEALPDDERPKSKYADFFGGPPSFVMYWNRATPPSPRCSWCLWFVPTPSWECN